MSVIQCSKHGAMAAFFVCPHVYSDFLSKEEDTTKFYYKIEDIIYDDYSDTYFVCKECIEEFELLSEHELPVKFVEDSFSVCSSCFNTFRSQGK